MIRTTQIRASERFVYFVSIEYRYPSSPGALSLHLVSSPYVMYIRDQVSQDYADTPYTERVNEARPSHWSYSSDWKNTAKSKLSARIFIYATLKHLGGSKYRYKFIF